MKCPYRSELSNGSCGLVCSGSSETFPAPEGAAPTLGSAYKDLSSTCPDETAD